MRAAGMITEYNPLHGGHVRLMRRARELLGQDTAIVCCMSGDFVQRGEFAVVRRQARAKAAVLSGADLVLELPLPWAVSSAEGFAEGAVSILNAAGVVDYLVFGSESGDAEAIQRTADLLLSPDFPPLLREELSRGDSFPAARQRAAVRLAARKTDANVETDTETAKTGMLTSRETAVNTVPETDGGTAEKTAAGTDIAALLSRPNDALAVEYGKALIRSGSPLRPVAVLRTGTAHDGADLRPGAYPSASAIRDLLRRGETETALSWTAPAMADVLREEIAAGRAPVFMETAEQAVLARLRSMSREDFA
ncbi:MAG: nucleotidyltransferase family protein, partial [Oscillibacter sp.]|nr:nucleotidyltransferase family protein [Oscillibacter sp.]